MKNKILLLTLLAGALCSCNDFLDREPLDAVPTDKYLMLEGDLAAYSANMYGILPQHGNGVYGLGLFATDNNSDNQTTLEPNHLFVKRQTRVGESGGAWDFGNIRTVNYFIDKVRPRWENGELTGNEDNIKHYLGEMYFMRAYIYYRELVALGDFPILKHWISEDYDAVREASKRRPRNEVARFIIQDLDSAYYLMKPVPPQTNRLTKDCAALLKSRVALFEGSWETYHKGTARVPGGPGWPGASKDYLKDFTIDIDSEIKYFLGQAMDAAKIVADNHPLSPDYEGLFNSGSLAGNQEVLLWKKFDTSLTPSVYHYAVGYLQQGCGQNGDGITRSLVESFLMKNGLPIYAAGSGYQGDKNYEDLDAGRDPRLGYTVTMPGTLLSTKAERHEYQVGGKAYYYRAPIQASAPATDAMCVTGYSIKKGLNTDPAQGPTKPSTTACVVFRAAEAYLNYMEADCMLNDGALGGDSRKYWQDIRTRAGVDIDYQKTIDATDLTQEIDLARYSGSSLVTPTLYNIRRERRDELVSEGLRFDDLKRWRALDMMQNYVVEGFNLWAENYKRYTDPNPTNPGTPDKPLAKKDLQEDKNVSSKAYSTYLCPFHIDAGNIAYDGYNWNQNKYLNPIAVDHFRLTTATEGSSDYESSTIYQNPGWKIEIDSFPDGD